MKANFFKKQGGTNVLQYGDIPTPKPKKGEALIRVRACGLNHLDLHLRNARLSVPLPHVSGSDVSGTIVRVNGRSNLRIGQAVVVNPAIPCKKCPRCKKGLSCEIVKIFGYNTRGGFAEFVTAPIEQVYLKPKNISFAEAAAFPLTFLTAWHMLASRAKLQRGETIFIWGATGGLGVAAIKIAKLLGARIIAATKLSKDARLVKRLGANHVVVYSRQNVQQSVKRLTKGQGVDVVFETVGNKTWNTSLAILRPHGRVVIAGTTSGPMGTQDLSDVYYYQQTILGARMGTREEFEKVLALVRTGKLKPLIDKVYPLRDMKKAQRRMENAKQVGKIVLQVS